MKKVLLQQCSICVFFLIQFDRYVEVFGYHYLHTQEDFLSDVGGFLGLFLGLSIFAVISLALDVAEKGGGKGKRGDDAGTDTSSSGISRKVFRRRNYPKFIVKCFCKFLFYLLV